MICEFSVAPVGIESMSDDVAKLIDLIDRSGIPYKTHAMGTIVEGEWGEVMELIKRCHDLMRNRHRRVLTRINIDDREHAGNRLTGKVESIERKLGRNIQK